MRNPSQVAEQIAEIVPGAHKEKFRRLIQSFAYKAVEQTGECWSLLSHLCNLLLENGALAEDWQVEMISVLTTKSKEELLEAQT